MEPIEIEVYEDDWWERVGQHITQEQFDAIMEASRVALPETDKKAVLGSFTVRK